MINRLFYGHEKGRGFAAGLHVESIRIINTVKKFEKTVAALTALDTIISEREEIFDVKNNKDYGSIIHHLFDHLLHKNSSQPLDPYIYNSFRYFVDQKQRL